ncbi:MAG: hypothetical protein J5486_01175, partial [Bacteroidaceae bacterium]|nr:hypothetical protein [Bacteroidaceae bacterium]
FRQASALSPTSFRFHLTMDTLVFDCALAAIRPRWGLAPVRLCPCRANQRKPLRMMQRGFLYNNV